MTVYLTGSSGFVGNSLLTYLQDGIFKFECLGREDLKEIGGISLVHGSTIVHLAGKAHDLKKVSDPGEYYSANSELTKELYDAFLRSNATKFIFISSVKASADRVDGVLSEEHLPRPETHYGKSKLMAEQYIQAQALPAGKSFYILRPCMIHGPGNKGNLNLFYRLISRGIPYPLAAFENKRSFLSVGNLCFVIQEILNRDDIPSGVYQVADDEAISTNELVRLIAEGSGRPIRLWKLNPNLIRFLAKLGDTFHLPLTSERLNKLTENYVVSNAKLKDVLQKELPLSARNGILYTIRSFQT